MPKQPLSQVDIDYINRSINSIGQPIYDEPEVEPGKPTQGDIDFINRQLNIGAPTHKFDMDSQYDVGLLPGRDSQEDYRAEQQSIGARMAHILPRLTSKIVTEVGKMPGYLVGAAMWGATGDIQKMVDNAWINTFEKLDEGVKEAFPVYLRDEVRDAGFWGKLSSASFWTSDAVDALGFFDHLRTSGPS